MNNNHIFQYFPLVSWHKHLNSDVCNHHIMCTNYRVLTLSLFCFCCYFSFSFLIIPTGRRGTLLIYLPVMCKIAFVFLHLYYSIKKIKSKKNNKKLKKIIDKIGNKIAWLGKYACRLLYACRVCLQGLLAGSACRPLGEGRGCE